MKVLVTGSAGHLGEALMRRMGGHEAEGLDIETSPFTRHVGSITDRTLVREAVTGMDAVVHTATLHKPHVATHARQDFLDVNLSGTLNLLEEAADAGVRTFVFTSTTSVFGDALRPPPGEPAAWITEEVQPVPKNIYGITKIAAEELCALFHRLHGMNVVVLRTSRFFPESDDDRAIREQFADDNVKTNEFLHRRVDIEDVVSAHQLALEGAATVGFDRFVISATTPFEREDAADLAKDAESVVRRRYPAFEDEYRRRGWRMFPSLTRVYDNAHARKRLGWRPRHDFESVLDRLRRGGDLLSPLAREIGAKGYHDRTFEDGPYPV